MGAAAAVWDRPDVVEGFVRSEPNTRLMAYARQHRRPWSSTRVLDIGCGAGRNAIPLAHDGFDVIGLDQSRPMLTAAQSHAGCRLRLIEATMDRLPVPGGSIDLIVAHGIWNLAQSDAECRAAIAEAARVASAGASLFVFTFSRRTLPPDARPVDGEELVYTQFSGRPQVFLTRDQLIGEMRDAGFALDREFPLRELNVPPPGQARLGGAPVIFEAAFRFAGKPASSLLPFDPIQVA